MIDIPFSEQAEMDDTSDDAGPGFESAAMDLTEMKHQPEHETGMEKSEIREFRAAAKEFNAAFDTALYELESSRKTIVERSIRIEELNESIKAVNVALNDEISKSHRKEEQFRLDTDQLNQRIQDIESERDHLRQLINEHETTLNLRAEEVSQLSLRVEELTGTLEQRTAEGQRAQEEISQLSSQLEELTGTLEQRTAEGQRAQEEFAHEQDRLTGKLNELQTHFDNAGAQLKAQQRELEDRDKEIAHISRQVNSLTTDLDSLMEASDKQDETHNLETTRLGAEILELTEKLQARELLLEERCGELESRDREIACQNDHISELKDKINAQSDSMRVQSESHANACEEHAREAEQLNQRIHDIESERDRLQQQAHEQDNTLNARAEEISQLSSRIEELTRTLELHTDEGLRAQEEFASERDILTARINELQELLDNANVQLKTLNNELEETIKAQSESMREQSESHANTCEELNTRIIYSSEKLESLQVTHKELEAHAEKIENLNRALYESSTSENTRHKRVLEDKDNENELLRTKLEAEVKQLHTAAQEARDTGSQGSVDAQSLQGQVADLQSALEDSRSEQEALASKLRDHEALEQEAMNLREAVQQANNKPLELADAVPGGEAEQPGSTLSASEQKCELQTALASATESVDTRDTDQTTAIKDLPTVAETINRGQFLSHLEKLLAERDGSGVNHTVMYALLDNFIRIRDEIGIINSELMINEISEIIISQCNDNDIVSRFGDCTFTILSCNESTDETYEKANRICSIIDKEIFEYAERSLITSTSIGICSIRKNDTSAEGIVSRADLACEAARSSGGNRVLVNSAIADNLITQDTGSNHGEMVSSALDENRIKIYYQPISSLNHSSDNHYEVLTRIVDKSGDIILPGEFFSMAAKSGKAVDIDLYVIENIMKMMSSNEHGQQLKLFIKLTRQSVADHELPLWIAGKIKEYKINPEQLVFEIAESVLKSDLKNLSMLSRAINAIGCKIAIEHYRLSTQAQHLLHIHADYLKIDSNLVENISRKGEVLSNVTAIMDIAKKHNYITIAEGVENAANLAILWELGVGFVQGYFIQAPAGNCEYDFHGTDGTDGEDEATDSNVATYTIG